MALFLSVAVLSVLGILTDPAIVLKLYPLIVLILIRLNWSLVFAFIVVVVCG